MIPSSDIKLKPHEKERILKTFDKQMRMTKTGKGQLVAKIKFIGPDGILRKFNEDNIVIITLRDGKGKIYTLRND